MVEPTFNTEDIDEFLDRIRIAKFKAEMRGQQQQIDRPSVVTIRRLESENARLKEALRESLKLSGFLSSCARGGEALSEKEEAWITKVGQKAREVLSDAALR